MSQDPTPSVLKSLPDLHPLSQIISNKDFLSSPLCNKDEPAVKVMLPMNIFYYQQVLELIFPSIKNFFLFLFFLDYIAEVSERIFFKGSKTAGV